MMKVIAMVMFVLSAWVEVLIGLIAASNNSAINSASEI
jgi:hypothetical protein